MQRFLPFGVGLLASALLAWNAAWRPNAALGELRPAGRYWEDLALAASAYLQRAQALERAAIVNGTPEAEDLKHAYRRNLMKGVDERDIRPWQFWRTVPLRAALDRGPIVQRPYEDAGRATLMAAGYALLGGVAPYLGLWIALLFAVPALVWVNCELWRAGLPVAAAAFVFALASSCFVAEVLTLAYSASGFHVVALLLLTALATYAFLGRGHSRAGLVARFAAAGLGFLACTLARSSTLALLPAFLLAAAAAGWRLAGSEAWRVRLARAAPPALLAAALFAAPWGVSRALQKPTQHDTWATLWEGLGDFDRTHEFAWSDPALRAYLRRHGLPVSEKEGIEFQGPESETIARDSMLRAIREDPAWYAGILAKRLLATVTLQKLWPYGPSDGRSMAPATHPNEGSIDVYWGMTTTADFFGLGPWRRELGVGLILAPLVALVFLWGAGRLGLVRPVGAPVAGQLGVLICLTIAALALPLIVSLAASFEPQSFLLVPLLGLGLLAQEIASRLGRGRVPASVAQGS